MRLGLLVLAWSALGCRSTQENLDFGDSNADVLRAYEVAKAEARQWHRNAFPGSLNIGIPAAGQVTFEAAFYGKSPFQKFTDVLTVQVDLMNGPLLYKEETKGSLEPHARESSQWPGAGVRLVRAVRGASRPPVPLSNCTR